MSGHEQTVVRKDDNRGQQGTTDVAGGQQGTVATEPRFTTMAFDVSEWVNNSVGYFSINQLYRDLKIDTREGKKNTSKILSRMADAKIVTRKPGVDGMFRRVIDVADSIDWQTADPNNVIPLKWVFSLESYVNIYSKNIILIAGAPNSGKTAYLLNFVYDNQAALPARINYYSSEMGAEEMKLRICKSGKPLDCWNFNAFSRSSNFADVVSPDAINVIDFLEVTDTFYKVGEEITNIFNALRKGIAVIAIQKKKSYTDFKGKQVDVELGRGAEFSLEKPRLYLSMDSGTCKVIKAKNWATDGVNPNGLTFSFKLVNGFRFIYTSNTLPI